MKHLLIAGATIVLLANCIAATEKHPSMEWKDIGLEISLSFCAKPVRNEVYLLPSKAGEKQKAVGFYHLREEAVTACPFKVNCFDREQAQCQKLRTTEDCFTYGVEVCTRENNRCRQFACETIKEL